MLNHWEALMRKLELGQGPVQTLLHIEVHEATRALLADAKAGLAYFNGAGGCNKCHSPTADLAGVGSKYEPPMLQQKFLFPRTFGVLRCLTIPFHGRKILSCVQRHRRPKAFFCHTERERYIPLEGEV